MKKGNGKYSILRSCCIGIGAGVAVLLAVTAIASILFEREYVGMDRVHVMAPCMECIAAFACVWCAIKTGEKCSFVYTLVVTAVLLILQLILGALLFSGFSATALWNALGSFLGGCIAFYLCKKSKKVRYKRKNRMFIC